MELLRSCYYRFMFDSESTLIGAEGVFGSRLPTGWPWDSFDHVIIGLGLLQSHPLDALCYL